MSTFWIPALVSLGLALAPLCAQAQDRPAGSAQEKQKAKAAASRSAGEKADAAEVEGPSVVLAPSAFTTDEKLANGCWARLYEDQSFRGDVLAVVGPVEIPNSKVDGFEWGRNFESVVVGPRATVTVYDNHNFRQKTATFKSGQRFSRLDEKAGLFQNIRSLKVTCS